MKRWNWLVAGLVVACGTAAWAEEGAVIVVQEGTGPVVIGGNPGGAVVVNPGGAQNPSVWGGGSGYVAYMDKIVGYTEEQKKQVAEIVEARQKAMQDFQTANAEKSKAAGKKITDAYKSGDQEAIAQANEEYQALYAPFHRIMKESAEKLDKVLTAEQKGKFQDYQATQSINSMTHGAKLTADQMKQLKQAYRDSTSGVEGAPSMQETLANVLTPEQKTGIRRNSLVMSAKAQFSTAKLTEEQLKQVDAICAELAKDDEPGYGAYKVMNEKVQALLTEEQKDAMKKAREAWMKPGAPLPERRRNPE